MLCRHRNVSSSFSNLQLKIGLLKKKKKKKKKAALRIPLTALTPPYFVNVPSQDLDFHRLTSWSFCVQ